MEQLKFYVVVELMKKQTWKIIVVESIQEMEHFVDFFTEN